MKVKKITSLLLVAILSVIALAGCGTKDNTEVVIDPDLDYEGIVTSEQNYFDMSKTDLEKVINAIADFEVCTRVQMKLLNNEEMYEKEIVENMYIGKELQKIEYACECEDENCEHRQAAEKFNSELTPVREFDQTEMHTWYGGPVALSEMKLNLVTYNVFPINEEEILISLKYREEDMSIQNIMGVYNNTKKLITSVN